MDIRKSDIITVIVAILICMLMLSIIKPTIVRETSMEPNLHDGNYVILSKVSYKTQEPEYGDIIVFKSDVDNGKMLIKRVIAKGGDEISIAGGKVYRNGKVIDEPYVSPDAEYDEEKSWEVPKGHLFVMGDNRNVSLDSRDESVGFVDEDTIVGKMVVRLFPFSQIGTVD